ncbi:hypothetical protein ACFQ1M_11445 [Sungkyunkwania multivorans]|uniref:Uncharacterized protein n=1 Tax=Sungkyunkwania multivorans TaxID=1173618 RepID=A0ABW3D124_9FLAO
MVGDSFVIQNIPIARPLLQLKSLPCSTWPFLFLPKLLKNGRGFFCHPKHPDRETAAAIEKSAMLHMAFFISSKTSKGVVGDSFAMQNIPIARPLLQLKSLPCFACSFLFLPKLLKLRFEFFQK